MGNICHKFLDDSLEGIRIKKTDIRYWYNDCKINGFSPNITNYTQYRNKHKRECCF